MEIGVIIGIILIIIVVIYAIVLFWAYRNQRFIFSPYEPNIGPGLFQPGGAVQQLSEEQILCRQYALGTLTGTPPASCATPGVDPYDTTNNGGTTNSDTN